jgi:hypothetical protein
MVAIESRDGERPEDGIKGIGFGWSLDIVIMGRSSREPLTTGTILRIATENVAISILTAYKHNQREKIINPKKKEYIRVTKNEEMSGYWRRSGEKTDEQSCRVRRP